MISVKSRAMNYKDFKKDYVKDLELLGITPNEQMQTYEYQIAHGKKIIQDLQKQLGVNNDNNR